MREPDMRQAGNDTEREPSSIQQRQSVRLEVRTIRAVAWWCRMLAGRATDPDIRHSRTRAAELLEQHAGASDKGRRRLGEERKGQ